MQTQTMPATNQMLNRITKLALGLLVLTLTLLLIFTAVAPLFNQLFIDDACETAAAGSFDSFSMETAVPDCWLAQ